MAENTVSIGKLVLASPDHDSSDLVPVIQKAPITITLKEPQDSKAYKAFQEATKKLQDAIAVLPAETQQTLDVQFEKCADALDAWDISKGEAREISQRLFSTAEKEIIAAPGIKEAYKAWRDAMTQAYKPTETEKAVQQYKDITPVDPKDIRKPEASTPVKE